MPRAEDGEREARRKRRRVDRERSPRGSKRMSTKAPPARGSCDAIRSDESAEIVSPLPFVLPEERSQIEITDKITAPATGQSPSSPNTVSPQPDLPEESADFTSNVDDVCDRISASMKQLLSDHAATEKLYAERVRRESEMCNLTVESAFCDIDDGSSRSCKARKVALLASQSVVGLSSFSDEKRIRVCSGFVIGSNGCTNTNKILTSATLVRSPTGHNFVVPDVKIKVCLPNGHISDGLISMVNFHYNIAVVEVKSGQKLPEAILVSEVITKGAVLAIGRFYDHSGVMCAQGKIRKQASTFDCSELLVSNCQTTMAGVGGPLVNYSGHVLGINFYGKNHTPFLSTAIILRCLEHWQNYGKVIQPWLGFMYNSVDMLPLRVLEKCAYADKGLYISKVAKGSPADVAGLCVGDVLIECAGKVLCTVPEFGAFLLDMCKEKMGTDSLKRNVTVEVVVRKQRDGSTARKTMVANVLRELNYYRWPAPMPSYNHKIMPRKQFMEFL